LTVIIFLPICFFFLPRWDHFYPVPPVLFPSSVLNSLFLKLLIPIANFPLLTWRLFPFIFSDQTAFSTVCTGLHLAFLPLREWPMRKPTRRIALALFDSSPFSFPGRSFSLTFNQGSSPSPSVNFPLKVVSCLPPLFSPSLHRKFPWKNSLAFYSSGRPNLPLSLAVSLHFTGFFVTLLIHSVNSPLF